jgi:hypothetical protein
LRGYNISKISSITKISRKAVAKYAKGKCIPGKKKISKHFIPVKNDCKMAERKEKKEEIIEFSKNIIESRKHDPPKQGLDKLTLHDMVRAKFVECPSYSSFCRWMKGLNMMSSHEVYSHLDFDKGEMLQVDFCKVRIKIEDVGYVDAKMFCCVLLYSFDIFAMIIPDEKRENFLFAHAKAFDYYTGAPRKAMYDNCSQVVDDNYGKFAKISAAMEVFRAHYGFEIVCANKGKGQDKGGVENLCKLVRKLALSNLGPMKNLKEAQEEVYKRLELYRQNHQVEKKPATVLEMSKDDRAELIKLPESSFTEGLRKEVEISKFRTFLYDTCEYSVPNLDPGTRMAILVTPYEIFCYFFGDVIWVHERSIKRNAKVLVASHYLDVYEKKPRSIENSLALKKGVLPPELAEFRLKCKEKNKNEQLVNIMLLSNERDPETVKKAVVRANKEKHPTFLYVTTLVRLIERGEDIEENGSDVMRGEQGMANIPFGPLSIYDEIFFVGNNWGEVSKMAETREPAEDTEPSEASEATEESEDSED